MTERESPASLSYVCRVHHRCAKCGGSGTIQIADPDWSPGMKSLSSKDSQGRRVTTVYPATKRGMVNRDCPTCHGAGITHATLSPGSTNDPKKADWLMPDDRPLCEVSIGSR